MSKLINDVIQVFNGTLNGGMVSCGNTCAVIGSVNDKISNFTKLDGTYTNNWHEIGSNSYLDIPLNSSISYAVLEWHSTVANNLTNGDMSEQYTPVTFITPLGTNQVFINSTDSTEATYIDSYNEKVSVKWQDVTNLVKQSGSGYYAVKGIPTATVGSLLNHNESPGWSLTVVYSNNNSPQRTVTLYIGLKQSIYTVSKANSAITIAGINVPSTPKKANLLIVASNGDPNYYAGLSIYKDISQVSNIGPNYYLGNSVDSTYENPNLGSIVPYDNMFSGIIMNTNTESSSYGQIEVRGTLGSNNNKSFDAIKQLSFQGNRGKLDILGFDISDKIYPLQNQLIVTVDTKKLPSGKPRIIVCGVQVDQTDKLANPNISFIKTTDKNSILVGDTVTFTIAISNTGSIPINQVVLNDSLLQEAIFVKNSLRINGNNVIGDVFPTKGVNLGNITSSQSINVAYQAKFTAVPLSNIVGINPSISYNYTNANQIVIPAFLIGTTSYLTVKSFNFISIANDVQDVFTQTLKGGVTITGNSLTVVGSVNNKSREFISQDGSLTTDWRQNGSQAYLDLPPNSIVIKAILEWNGTIAYGGAIMSEANDPIVFKTPTATFNVTAMGEGRFDGGNNYIHSAKWADVTSYVNGIGTYGVNRVPSAQDATMDNVGKTGWSLTVVYSNLSLPNRFINIKMGFKPNNSNFTAQQMAVTFTGFTVPNTPGKAHLMTVSSDGVPNVKNGLNIFSNINNITNSSMQYALGNKTSSTSQDPGTIPIVPYDNIFGGFIMNTNTENTNYYGKIETRGTLGNLNNSPYNISSEPSFTGNRSKHDILAFDISNAMTANQNTLITLVNMLDSTEWILNSVYALQIDQIQTIAPIISANKTSLRRGVYLGENVTYTIVLQNNSSINVTGVMLLDEVPQGATLVANSISINGTIFNTTFIPSDGINVGSLASGSNVTITYQVIFNYTPTSNPVLIQPSLNYNYLDSNNNNQTMSVTGTSTSLFVAYIQKPVPTLNGVQDIYVNTIKGGLTITGNALTVVGSSNNKSNAFITELGGTTTDWRQNGSAAILDIPLGSTVVSAYLEWYSSISVNGSEMLESYEPVIFKTPTSNHIIYATGETRFNIDSLNINSSKWADVTSYVFKNGSGQYLINRVPSAQNATVDNDQITGWSLIVVYYNSNLPNRFINVKVGLNPNNKNFTKLQRAVTFTGFKFVPIATKSYFMMVAANGIPNVKNGLSIYSDVNTLNTTGVAYQVGNSSSSTGLDPGTIPIVPYDNVFGGFIMNTNTESTSFGTIDTRGTLGTKNNSPYNINSEPSFTGNRAKHDILAFDISSKMSSGQNTLIATVEDLDLANEWILGMIYAVQVDVSPVIVTKISSRLGVYLGEILTYTITINNIGTINLTNIMLIEQMPQGASLIANSITVNGTVITAITLQASGIPIGSLIANSTATVTYQISFATAPVTNPIGLNPVVNYSYLDSNNVTQTGSLTGTSTLLYVATNQKLTYTTNTVKDVYNNTLNGGVVITGNSLIVVGSTNSSGREFIQQNGALTTDWHMNGSLGYLDIPANSIIVKAYLEWYGSVNSGTADMPEAYEPIIFKTPTLTYTVFATNEIRFNNNSSKWLDVTSYVASAGLYAVNRVPSNQTASADHGSVTGWCLVVVYSNSSLLTRFVDVKMGFNPANSNFTKTQRAVTFTGFTVPSNPGKSHLMMVASAGTPNYKNGLSVYNNISNISSTGVSYQVGNSSSCTGQDPGTSPIIPYDNIFGGFIMNTNTQSTSYGTIDTRGTLGSSNNTPYNIGSEPSFTGNRAKHDILAFDISSKTSAGQNTLIATVEGLDLANEWVLGMAYAIQVDVSTSTLIQPTMIVSKTSSVNSVNTGTSVAYTITVGNIGGITANSVMLMESIPQNSSLVANSLTVAGILVSGTTLPSLGISLGNIAVGVSVTVNYQVIFSAVPTTNPVSILPVINYSYLNASNLSQSASFTGTSSSLTVNQLIVIPPTMTASKTSDKTTANTGDAITYTIIVGNITGTTAKSVTLIESVPQGASFVLNSLTVNGTSVAGTTLPTAGITIGDIAVGGSSTITYKVIFNSVPTINPVAIKPLINYSYLDASNSSQTLSFTGNSTSLTINQSAAVPVLVVNRTANKISSNIGDTIIYTIVISNTTTSAITNVTLVEPILQGENINQNSVTINGVVISNASIQYVVTSSTSFLIPIGTLQSNSTAIVVYSANFTIASSNTLSLTSVLNYSYINNQGVTQNTSSNATTVPVTPIMSINKSSDKTTANIGYTVTYTVNILNYGGTSANNIMLMEIVPQGTTLVANSLTVNGNSIMGSTISSSGINIGNLSIGSSTIVIYKVIFNSVPIVNPVVNNPVINYSYYDQTNSIVSSSFIGTTSALTIQATSLIPVMSVSKSTDKIIALVGDTITFTITVSNENGITANSVILQESIPPNATFVSNSLTINGNLLRGNSFPIGGLNLGNVIVGSSIIVIYKIIFNSVPIVNPISLSPSISYNYVNSNNAIQITSMTGLAATLIILSPPPIINGIPNVIAKKVINRSSVGLGDQIKFTITVNNNSGGNANNIILLESLPVNSSLLPNSLMVDGIVIMGNTLPISGITLGSLSAGQNIIVSYILSFYAIPQPNPFVANSEINYSYLDSSGTLQKNSTIANSSNSVLVTANPIEKIAFYCNKTNAVSGDIITYTLVLKNISGVVAKNVNIKDIIPTGMTYVKGSLTVNNVAISGDLNVGVLIPDINSSQQVIINFSAKVN